MSTQHFVTIIIPVHNGGEYIEKCLTALKISSYPFFEIILVDDSSTDDTVSKVRNMGVKVLQLPKQSGPAVARNFGARHAKGSILFFVDSDVIVRRETLSLVLESFNRYPDLGAVFGSYDDDPGDEGFISQYRNLLHHFHHQDSDANAVTFWAGCGAIRKKVFDEFGGFNDQQYFKPSIEDIELGYRISTRGYKIILDKDLQVKHLKRWKFLSMVRTDIFQRAIPWSRLILETKFMPKGLNLKTSHKMSSISVALIILMIPLLFLTHTEFHGIPVSPAASLFSSILLTILFFLNRKLYGFYARKRGVRFMIRVLPFHFLYYFYSGISFVFSWIAYKMSTLYHPNVVED